MWPRGYGLAEQNGHVWITDDAGAPIAEMGQQIQMGGGITTLKDVQSIVPRDIPAACQVTGPDAYWVGLSLSSTADL